tara:strand:+ start:678 stop:2243 length:1566 start_codon:yes stop_codon:yes gene_type:complete
MSNRPNIVLIQADQLTSQVLPMYGNNMALVPNITALADQGITFLNSYCNNPVCGPSRASMMSGQLSSAVGCYDNAGEFLSSVPTFAHYLRDLDYKTCLSGKMHFVGADQLHGFEERLTTDIYPSDFGWTADWCQQDEPYAPSRMSLRSIVEAGLCKRSLQIDYDEDVCYQAVQKIYDFARDKNRNPFMLMASFTHPHNPFVTTQEFWDLYDHNNINMPRIPWSPVSSRDPWSQRYALTIREDEHNVTEEDIRKSRHAYLGMVSYFDSLIGRIVKTLKECDFYDNTYIFVVADHGEMLGERGTWFKFLPFEWSVRVPMIASGPNVVKGKVENHYTSLVDLLPTFVDLANNEKKYEFSDNVDGKSLVNFMKGRETKIPNELMLEFTGEGVYAPALIFIRDGIKYIHCRTDPPMMFDLNLDPGETKNLANDPTYSIIAKEMKSEIEKRWNYDELEQNVLRSQKRRLFVQDTLLKGKWSGWDHQPFVDAKKAYVRGAIDPSTTATKARRRYPFVDTIEPHNPRKK